MLIVIDVLTFKSSFEEMIFNNLSFINLNLASEEGHGGFSGGELLTLLLKCIFFD